MKQVSELTVILKFESSTYKEKFLLYDTYTISADDPMIVSCIKTAVKSCPDQTPEQIKIRISVECQ